MTDVIVIFNFRLFFALLLLPPPPPNSPKNENFKKMKKEKKTPGDIILHKCTKNYDDIL